jgi:hypothetical protein
MQRWDPGGVTASSVTNSGFFKIGATGTLGTVEKLRVTDPTTVDNTANVMIGTSATTGAVEGIDTTTSLEFPVEPPGGVIIVVALPFVSELLF